MKSVAEVIDSVRLVGRETGFVQEAEAEALRLEAGFDKIRDVVSKAEAEQAGDAGEGGATAEGTSGGVHKKKKVAFLEVRG